MRVVLETRCGCKRALFVPEHQYGRTIRVPMFNRTFLAMKDDATMLDVEYREFDWAGNIDGIEIYQERTP
jgi:hypothetical protein